MARVTQSKADLESLGSGRLDDDEQRELLEAQPDCTFVYLDHRGWPSGVVMSYALDEGMFWLTSVEGRAQVRAVRRDPRVTLVVSSAGTTIPGRRMMSLRGTAEVQADPADRDRALDLLSVRLAPQAAASFRHRLDTPRRVVLAVTPVAVSTSYGHDKLRGA